MESSQPAIGTREECITNTRDRLEAGRPSLGADSESEKLIVVLEFAIGAFYKRERRHMADYDIQAAVSTNFLLVESWRVGGQA
jgi:hypothetical protein